MTIQCWPVDKDYGVSSGHGYRWGALHDGIDIPCPTGTPIYAAHDGVVQNPPFDSGGYGIWVQVNGPNGWTQYGHLSRNNIVPTGTRVTAGTLIGISGNTGGSTGPHLHFRYRPNGAGPTDPAPYLQGKPFASVGGGAVADPEAESINHGAMTPTYD
jgi:murein DD-endopeptidase MepM/ murein hydrolase activator NlpD